MKDRNRYLGGDNRRAIRILRKARLKGRIQKHDAAWVLDYVQRLQKERPQEPGQAA